MKRPGYREAIRWIVLNDDITNMLEREDAPASVTAALVADLFDVGDVRVIRDIKRAWERRLKELEALNR